jgi:hypothetical protein
VDDETNDHLPGEIPGVDDEPTTNSLESPGVDPDLETYVNEVEAKLDQGIADLDSDYIPDESDDESTRADATREQASADNDANNGTEDNNNVVPALVPRLRQNRTPNYRHMKGRDGDGLLQTLAQPEEFRGSRHQSHVILQSIIMTQYNLWQGIKKFRDLGKAAVLTELQQLNNRNVMRPVNKYDLTPAERKGALRYLMFLKEKRCGTIKGRGCADGRSQREYMSKEETSSLTVATEALILTCVIDAMEGRDVATCGIPGAFMRSDVKGKVVIKLEGVMAKVILKINPRKYTTHVVKENGKDIIYIILQKALYGTLQAAFLFWQNLSTQLVEWGFETNPYDFCVANKIIDGKQCTIVWHVDDLKISHLDPKVNTTILNLLDAKYGQEIVGGKRARLTINRGKKHDYLGMILDYSEAGFVKIDMCANLQKILQEMPEP